VLKNFDFNLKQKHSNNIHLHKILCEFCIDNHRYLILPYLHEYIENPHSSSNATSLHQFQESEFLEASQFELNGNLYTVIEVGNTQSDSEVSLANLLTARELQIATLVATGSSNKQIAKQLHISEWTVATYLRRIFSKLGVDNRAAMVYRCASLIQQSQDPEIVEFP
jgi:ATP/maltotriose-dependent transcriptional regulator MalT